MSEDKPQWPVGVVTKTKASHKEWQSEYLCDPMANPLIAAGWEFDNRGKPCKWQRHAVVTEDEIVAAGGILAIESLCRAKAAQDMQLCQAALKLLEGLPDIFVVRVHPEQHVSRNTEHHCVTITTRCRVRWCENEHVAARHAEFEQHTLAEVDREWADGKLYGRR